MTLMQMCRNAITHEFQTQLVQNVLLVLDASTYLGQIQVKEESDDTIIFSFSILITSRPFDCFDDEDGDLDFFFGPSNVVSKAIQQLNSGERQISVGFRLGDSMKDNDGEHVVVCSDFTVTLTLQLAFT